MSCLEICPWCCGAGWISHPEDDHGGRCALCDGNGSVPIATDEEIANAGRWGRAIWQSVKDALDGA